MQEDLLESLVGKLGCEVGKQPFTYLGLPVWGNPRSKRFWNPVIERVEKRLVGWGRNYEIIYH